MLGIRIDSSNCSIVFYSSILLLFTAVSSTGSIVYAQSEENANIFFKIGKSLVEKDKPTEAIEYYNKAIDEDPTNATYYAFKSYGYNFLDAYENALDTIDIGILLDPKNDTYHFQRAYYLDRLDRNEEAVEEYEKAIQLNPNNTEIYWRINNPLLELERYQDIINNFDRVIKIEPNNTNLYYEKGAFVRSFLQNDQEALKTFEDALSIWPDNATFNFQKAITLRSMNQSNQAIEYFNRAIELDPTDYSYYEVLGNTFFELGKYKEAIDYYEKAINSGTEFESRWFETDLPKILSQRGLAFAQLQNYTESMKSLNKAIEILPNSSFIHEEKAKALMILNAYDKATDRYDSQVSIIDSVLSDIDDKNPNTTLIMENEISCGDIITTDIILTSSLDCSGDGLIIDNQTGLHIDLNGFTISGPGKMSGLVGILIVNSSSVEISGGGNITNFQAGILNSESERVRISNTTFTGNENGIFNTEMSDIVVSNSSFSSNSIGFSSHSSEHLQIIGNIFDSNELAGLSFVNSDWSHITSNIIEGSVNGIYLDGQSANNKVSLNKVVENSEVDLNNGNGISSKTNHNTFSDNNCNTSVPDGLCLGI